MGTNHSSNNALGALGANYNEKLNWINHRELASVKAQWIRGFIDMHQINPQAVSADTNLQSLFNARDAGFKVILSFKWNYLDKDFPSVGSPDHQAELDCLNSVLAYVMGQVDILVIGNEPYIEAKSEHRLNEFYESMAETVVAFKKNLLQYQNQSRPQPHIEPQHHQHPLHLHRHEEQPQFQLQPKETKLFMGAVNRLDLPKNRTSSITRFLTYISSSPYLAGVDIHLHLPTLTAHKEMLNYTLQFIRPDQRYLVTEFSMVWYFKSHLNDPVNPAFLRKHNFPAGSKVYEILSAGIKSPFDIEVWTEFLKGEQWYASCRGFLEEVMGLYRSTGKLEVATYSFCPMRMRKKPVEAGDNPWMLNGIVAPSMVKALPGGEKALNWPWAEEFVRAQDY